MSLFAKGLSILGLAVIFSVSFSSTAQAASLLDLFGQKSQEGSHNTPTDSQKPWWYDPFNRDPNPPDTTEPDTPNPNKPDDQDSDGLTTAQEAEQHTNDTVADTDNDGLTDFIESKWNTDRNAVFCGTECAYPNPTQKDIYMEIDWMVRPNGATTQPNAHQLTMMRDAFTKEGILMHIDVGQYGGGNQAPYNAEIWFGATAGEADFVDYKRGGDGIAAQFNAKRNTSWHYMLVGERYKSIKDNKVENGSSGVANLSGPNMFIAAGTMPDRSPDMFMAGTMMHELGHNLCLTGRPASTTITNACSFPGIDNHESRQPNYPYKDYKSSMNYLYQFRVADYSHNPTNSPTDHNDWAAIKLDTFAKYSERANGQTQDTAHTHKRENNILENLQHVISVDIQL